jgi:hypothetical protein
MALPVPLAVVSLVAPPVALLTAALPLDIAVVILLAGMFYLFPTTK